MNIYHQIPELQQTAIALGCFDGIHLGHRAVIEKLSTRQSERFDTSVLSFSDELIIKKGAEQIASFDDKCRILAQMNVSELILPSFASLKDYAPVDFFHDILVKKLDARLLVCGENYRFGRHAAGNSDMLRELCSRQGIECIIVPPVMYQGELISSSRIREALSEGRVEEAAQMLGRPFSYCFEVVHGRELGRQMGTPTINQYFPLNFLIPAYGVYASVTEIEGKTYASVTNIGVKPTVGSNKPLSETWIIGYYGDLYGKHIRVSLISYMRKECRFDSIDSLKKAIHHDGVTSKSLTENYLD